MKSINGINGMSNISIREKNLRNLTKLVYLKKDGWTKQELQTALNLSLPTVNSLLQEMKQENLISKTTGTSSSGGRIPFQLTFNYRAKYVIGVEISGRFNDVLLMDMECNIIDKIHNDVVFDNTSTYLKELSKSTQDLLEQNNVPAQDFLGVGIGVHAPVRKTNKMLELAPTVKLNNYYYDQLEHIFGYPVLMENEANAAGFAEVSIRDDIRSAAYLSVKSKGVGGAIIIDNNLFYGAHSRAAEFGHVTLFPGGVLCKCGRTGCVEAYCATRELSDHTDGSIEQFFEQKDSDRHLQRIWEVYLEHLALAIDSLYITLDMPIILGGELIHFIGEDFHQLQENVENNIPYDNDSPVLIGAKINQHAAAIGAALMCIYNYLNID